jgi:hypothetical protein
MSLFTPEELRYLLAERRLARRPNISTENPRNGH